MWLLFFGIFLIIMMYLRFILLPLWDMDEESEVKHEEFDDKDFL